jgi:hypothetical protein
VFFGNFVAAAREGEKLPFAEGARGRINEENEFFWRCRSVTRRHNRIPDRESEALNVSENEIERIIIYIYKRYAGQNAIKSVGFEFFVFHQIVNRIADASK